jgi:hypothetical protein
MGCFVHGQAAKESQLLNTRALPRRTNTLKLQATGYKLEYYRKGSAAAPACSATASSSHFWNSSALWTVTMPRIRA